MSEQIYSFSPPPHVSLYFMPSFSPLLPFFFFSCLHRKFSGDARFSRGNAISLSPRTPSSPPSQHLSHSKLQLGGVSGLAVITGRNHERGEEVDGNVCTRRGSGCRGGCDTCKSRPRFDPSPSCFETAFLFFTSEMKWSTTWVGLQWKWKLPSYFFFAYPSSLVVEPLCVWDFTATYTPTFASLLLRRKRRSAGGVPCFSYRPQTLLTSIFYPKASYSEQSHDNTWVTVLPCVTRSSIMINMPCWIVVLHSKAPTEDFKWRFNCLLWHHHLN